MIVKEFIKGDELPYRVMIDGHLHGAGIDPSRAVMAALSVGNKIKYNAFYTTPPNVKRRDAKGIARYLFWNYEMNDTIAELIHILDTGSFE